MYNKNKQFESYVLETIGMTTEEQYEYFQKAAYAVSAEEKAQPLTKRKLIEIPLKYYLLLEALTEGQKLGKSAADIVAECNA